MLEVFFEKYKPCLLAKNHDCKNGVGKETENSVKHSKMKRVNNLYAKIYELDNIILVDETDFPFITTIQKNNEYFEFT